jgi:hypothetical protein
MVASWSLLESVTLAQELDQLRLVLLHLLLKAAHDPVLVCDST